MSKGVLEFNRDNEFENSAFIRAVNADKTYLALLDITSHFRDLLKYQELEDEQYKIAETLDNVIREILSERGINLDDLP